MPESLQNLLSKDALKARVAEIDLSTLMPWPVAAQSGDTVWMGALDKNGVMGELFKVFSGSSDPESLSGVWLSVE